jgi:hypothetical protein
MVHVFHAPCKAVAKCGLQCRRWSILLKKFQSRKSKIVANLPKYQRHLPLTLIAAADRFRTRFVDSEVDDEAPASASENRTHSAEKIGPSRYSDFSTESVNRVISSALQ